jgi:hypothetical protein
MTGPGIMAGAARALGPWGGLTVDAAGWCEAIRALSTGQIDLISLWAEPDRVHMALASGPGQATVIDLACPDGDFPSVGAAHPPAIRLERAACDLYGLSADGAIDQRP